MAEHHAVPIADVDVSGAAPVPVGIPELDRVLVGGLVPGSVTLVSGEPGIGKSTLLLQAASGMATADPSAPVLYVSAEEAVTQVRRRADRLGTMPEGLLLTGDASVDAIEAAIEAHRPSVVVVDSIQTIFDRSVASGAGSVAQVRACAHRLAALARSGGTSLVLIGHVTKDGAVAGPRVLEHLVDTVLSFEGDRHHELRFLRATKHRFGPTDELGVFTMAAKGLQGVADAGALFLADRRVEVPGSVVVPVLDGLRPLLVEVQALTCAERRRRPPTAPCRASTGGDSTWCSRCSPSAPASGAITGDVYVSVAGGMRAVEPGVDLGMAIAVASASIGVPVRARRGGVRRARPRRRGAPGAWHGPPDRRGRPTGLRTCDRARGHPRPARRSRHRARPGGRPVRGAVADCSRGRWHHHASTPSLTCMFFVTRKMGACPLGEAKPSTTRSRRSRPASRCARGSTASSRRAWAR